jgi:hypothetical protein
MDVEAAASSNTHPAGSQEAIAAILGTFLELVERGVTACERIADASERIADAEEEAILPDSELSDVDAPEPVVSGNAE